MGFNVWITAFDKSVGDEAIRPILEYHVTHGIGSLEQWQYVLRISQITEIRELTWERVLQHQDQQTAAQIYRRHTQCKESVIPTISYLVISVYLPLFISFLQHYNCVMT